ncbi:MAG: radical SAM protein [Candidatus Eremiobacteraeota bacterium]|nr:radical SAM protein [Candidatus Eremiobacteraeota bacterium]
MKVALITPRGAERNTQDLLIREILEILQEDIALIGDDTEFVPNLGMLTLAGLFPEDTELYYLEEEYIPLDRVEEKLFGTRYDLVCFTGYNPQAFRAYELAEIYRKEGIPTIMGGLHASGIPQEAAQHVDAVVVGEAEDIFHRVLEDLKNNNLKKIYYSPNQAELSSSPVPRYDIVPNLALYNKIPLIATRGCPYSCEFCCFPTTYGRKFRKKPVEQVVEEILMVRDLHPRPYFSFSDENMLADHRYSKELARAFIPLKIDWECYCDISIGEDDELLELLAESGCRLVQVGLETLDPKNMENVEPWKADRIEKYPEIIKKIQSYGIPFMGMFIIGMDYDDPGVFRRLYNFILETGLAEMDFAILTPMPGTKLFERLKSEGRILSKNWNHYTWTHVNFRPMKMSPVELERGMLWLFSRFTRLSARMKEKSGKTPLPFHVIHQVETGSRANKSRSEL